MNLRGFLYGLALGVVVSAAIVIAALRLLPEQ